MTKQEFDKCKVLIKPKQREVAEKAFGVFEKNGINLEIDSGSFPDEEECEFDIISATVQVVIKAFQNKPPF